MMTRYGLMFAAAALAGSIFTGCDGPCTRRYTEVALIAPLPPAPVMATVTLRGGPPLYEQIVGTDEAPQEISAGYAPSPSDVCFLTTAPGMWQIQVGLADQATGKRPVALTMQGGVSACIPHHDISGAFAYDRSQCNTGPGYNQGP